MKIFITAWLCSFSMVVLADHLAATEVTGREGPLSDREWQVIGERMALLNNVSYLPSLLPVIMRNREALGLSDQQVAALRLWRREHYQHMVDLMNTIIAKRIELSQHAVDPQVEQSRLVAMQDELFRLQREVFLIRLSCRELVTGTFSEEQWANFAFIAADDPKIAGLLQ